MSLKFLYPAQVLVFNETPQMKRGQIILNGQLGEYLKIRNIWGGLWKSIKQNTWLQRLKMAFTYIISVEIAVISSLSFIQNPCKESAIDLIGKIYTSHQKYVHSICFKLMYCHKKCHNYS